MNERYQKYYLPGTLLIFLLYHAPTIFLGSGAFYNAFDSLDSYVVWYRMVTRQPYAWAPPFTIVEPFMGGVPKFTLVSTFNVYYWLNLLLPTFRAYQFFTIFISAVALAGMWLLARRHLQMTSLAASFLGLSFAFTPFLLTWGLSIAGQPLVLYAILNIRKREVNVYNWLIIIAFPFASNFQSAGVFILFALGLLVLHDFYKKFPVKNLLIAFGILLVFYCITKIDLIQNLVGGKGFVSHRMDMLRFPTSPAVCLKVFARYFLLGNVDVALSLHTFVLLPFVLSVYCMEVVRKKRLPTMLTCTLAIITLICIYIGALQWEPVVKLRNQSDLLRMYSLERFHIFLQLLWHVATAQAILLISSAYQKRAVALIAIIQLTLSFAYQPTYYERFFKRFVTIVPYHYIFTYDDYYAETMFRSIKSYIQKPVNTYRVASIGMPPGIAQYNGMWTIDGYSSNYPVLYKRQFRRIIDSELAKNEINRGFFDFWGSQCLIVYDQGHNYFETHMTRGTAPPDRDIKLTHNALKQLHCDYIISAENIKDPEKSGLRKLSIFSSALWRVHLYQVIQDH